MSWGLLFSGQGTQHDQMLPWLDGGDELVRRTEAALGVPDWRAAMNDAAWASRNRNVQVLLTGIALAAWQQLSPYLAQPAAVAGYSVGELAAFAAAGVVDGATAIGLAASRARAMDAAAADCPGGLLAVSGLALSSLERLCVDSGAAIAIRNASDAAVVGGSTAALSRLEQRAIDSGAKCTALNVEVASHTPAMQPAAEAFAAHLRAAPLRPPRTALFCNASADRIMSADAAARALSLQIAQTVQWAGCMEAMHGRRVSCVLEVGPGTALATMWRRRYPDVPARSADEFRSARAVADWVLRNVAS